MMPRIRTFKPDFFRHELLQRLEVAHGELKPMLVFLALWGHCDKEGRFAWKPRTLKLDILPFVPFDLEATLELLSENKFLIRYESRGEVFGLIPTFKMHQRITGKEAESSARYPRPYEKQPGNIGETPEQQPEAQELGIRKGRELGREAGREGGMGETVKTVENSEISDATAKSKPAPLGEKAKPNMLADLTKAKAMPGSTAHSKRIQHLRQQTQQILMRRQ
jgi:hypothetical protein